MTDQSQPGLQGRAALVTGSTDGLGLAIAASLAEAGCSVMLHGLLPECDAPVASLRRFGGDVRYVRADLSSDEGVAAAVGVAQAAFGALHILVNNAVVRHFAPVEDVPLPDWRQALAVNLTAPFHATQLALPAMRRAGWGRIVNMASVYGQRGTVNRVGYVTTKAAIVGLTRAVAAEVAGAAITCNAVCPGSVSTPGTEARVEALMARDGLGRAEAVARFVAGKQPSGRFVAAESVAAMVLLLCGPAGADINGAVLPVDGGWLAI